MTALHHEVGFRVRLFVLNEAFFSIIFPTIITTTTKIRYSPPFAKLKILVMKHFVCLTLVAVIQKMLD